jgi:hypothetical protein
VVMTPVRHPIGVGPERLAQDLFPEARTRRRRIRIAAATIAAVVVLGTVVGFRYNTLFLTGRPSTSALPQQVLPPGHITSLVWTMTYPDGPQWGVNAVEVATTLSRSAPAADTETLDTMTDVAGRNAKLEMVTLGTDTYLAAPDPWVPSTGNRVCWTVGPQPAGLQVILGPALSSQHTTCRTVTKPWIEIPDVSSANASLLELPVLEPPGTSVQIETSGQLATLRSELDPSELFGELHRTASSLTRTGTATIDGVPTTAYKGAIQPGVGARVAPSEVSSLYYSGLGADSNYNRLVEGIETFTVWVDHEGVVRRVLVDHFDSIVPDTEFTFTDFNRPIPKLPVDQGQVFLLPRGAWNITIGGMSYG